jgi:hypothetical protein
MDEERGQRARRRPKERGIDERGHRIGHRQRREGRVLRRED